MSSASVVSKAIMKGGGKSIHGLHQEMVVNPQTLSGFPLNQSSLTESLFYLPNTCMSLGESSLSFNLAVTAGAVGWNALWACGNTIIDSISLYTSSGVFLANIDSQAEFSRAILPLSTKVADLPTLDSSLGSTTLALSKAGDRGSGLFCSNSASSATFAVGASGTRIQAGAYAPADRSYTEPQYIKAVGASAGASFYNVSIPFKSFKHTLLADEENLYFNDSLQLRVRFNNTLKLGYINGNADINVLTTTTGILACAIAELQVILAVEKDPQAVAVAIAKCNSGYSKLVPYVTTFSQSSSGTSSSQLVQLNRGFGKKLLNIVSASYSSLDTTGFTKWDINNVANAKITSFNTYLDSTQQQINLVQCNNNDDYEIMKSMLKGTVTGLSSNVYKYNRVFCDSWRDPLVSYADYDDNVEDGIDLSINRTYSLNKTQVNGTYKDYMWVIAQRVLTISAGGCTME